MITKQYFRFIIDLDTEKIVYESDITKNVNRWVDKSDKAWLKFEREHGGNMVGNDGIEPFGKQVYVVLDEWGEIV